MSTTTTTTTPSPLPPLASLVDEPKVQASAVGAQARPSAPRTSLPAWTRDTRVRVGALLALVLAIGLGLWLYLRPTPQPDFASAPMDDLLNYTLLTDGFNNLPVNERLELIRELIDRFKNMGSGDSVLMAAFAASIDSDKLREQLTKNASLVAIDVWDQYAIKYQNVAADDRGQYLDNTFLEFSHLMDTLSGQTNPKTDEERLKEARDQAKRDQDMFQSGKGPTGSQIARMTDFMRNRMGQHSNPQQQLRGQQLMRDMTRHMRGKD